MPKENKARMIGTYEVLQSIHIGDREVLLCEDKTAEQRYACCYYHQGNIIGEATEGEGSNDYLEVMELFCQRVQGQIEQMKAARLPDMEVITAAMCHPNDYDQSIDGKVIAIKSEVLRPEYRSAEHQLHLVCGGNGARGGARGRAVFCQNLHSGQRSRYERYEVQGEVKPECLPKWAKEKADAVELNGSRERSDKGAR
jgi:hypothetical protein